MPGPGSHLLYSLGCAAALQQASRGAFSPRHGLVLAANATLGPDLGSLLQWLAARAAPRAGDLAMAAVHHPLGYVALLGLPLAYFYSWLTAPSPNNSISLPGDKIPVAKCFLLVTAGCLTHFFLDNLFEENGQTPLYRWIISTGWWDGPAPIEPESVIVIGSLCVALLVGFYFINRPQAGKSFSRANGARTAVLLLVIGSLHCLWCSFQLYVRKPRRAALGEEADLGVITFLAVFFFLPYILCLASLHSPAPDKLPVTT
eukprot:SM000211S06617  [mRNA]  locus=s211:25842:27497:+ [translate_table: standard]